MLDKIGLDELEVLSSVLPYIAERRRPDLAARILKNRSRLSGPDRGSAMLAALREFPAEGVESMPVGLDVLALYFRNEWQRMDCDMCRRNMVGAAAARTDRLGFLQAVKDVCQVDLDWFLYRCVRELVSRRVGLLTPVEARAGWQALLEEAGGMNRSRFLVCMAEMIPVLAAFGGDRALSQALRQVLEVKRIWP